MTPPPFLYRWAANTDDADLCRLMGLHLQVVTAGYPEPGGPLVVTTVCANPDVLACLADKHREAVAVALERCAPGTVWRLEAATEEAGKES